MASEQKHTTPRASGFMRRGFPLASAHFARCGCLVLRQNRGWRGGFSGTLGQAIDFFFFLISVYTVCVSVCRGQERELGPDENRIWVLCKISKRSSPLGYLSSSRPDNFTIRAAES